MSETAEVGNQLSFIRVCVAFSFILNGQVFV